MKTSAERREGISRRTQETSVLLRRVGFLLTLIKENDWLGSKAGRLYKEHEGDLVTSSHALLEILMVLDMEEVEDVPELVADILEIAELLYVNEETAFQAAFYMEEGATPFDAFHAALSNGRAIIGSDKNYDELGLERIRLED